jgi:hypothetical protein
MLKDLIKIATTLDSMGLIQEANQIDYMIKKIATNPSRIEQLYNDEMIMEKVKFIWSTELEAGVARSNRREMTDSLRRTIDERDRLFAELESLGVSKEDIGQLELYKDEQGRIQFELKKTSVYLSRTCTNLSSSLQRIKNIKDAMERIKENSELSDHYKDGLRIFGDKDLNAELDRYTQLTKSIVGMIQGSDFTGAKEIASSLLGEYREVWSHYIQNSSGNDIGAVAELFYNVIKDLKDALLKLEEVVIFIEEGRGMTEDQKASIYRSCEIIINKF